MALTAAVTIVCVLTFAAIRWLAALGIVRAYAVADVSTGGQYSYHQALGLAAGPSAALTHLDHRSGQIAIVAGVLWMARLALRAADRRIGVLRTLFMFTGLGVFIGAGTMHQTTDAVVPADRRSRVHAAVTLICFAFCIAVALLLVAGTGPQNHLLACRARRANT